MVRHRATPIWSAGRCTTSSMTRTSNDSLSTSTVRSRWTTSSARLRRRACVDWNAHVATLVRFWSWQLLGEPGYDGNPLRAHEPIHRRTPLRQEHYDRWLELFVGTIAELFVGPRAEMAEVRGRKMAVAMQRLLDGNSAPGDEPIEAALLGSRRVRVRFRSASDREVTQTRRSDRPFASHPVCVAYSDLGVGNRDANDGGRGPVDGAASCPSARTCEHREVKAPPFRYHRPDTLADALALLAEHGDDAKVLAGGQSLVPLMAMRMGRPRWWSTSVACQGSTPSRSAPTGRARSARWSARGGRAFRRGRRARAACPSRHAPHRPPGDPHPRHGRRVDRPRRSCGGDARGGPRRRGDDDGLVDVRRTVDPRRRLLRGVPPDRAACRRDPHPRDVPCLAHRRGRVGRRGRPPPRRLRPRRPRHEDRTRRRHDHRRRPGLLRCGVDGDPCHRGGTDPRRNVGTARRRRSRRGGRRRRARSTGRPPRTTAYRKHLAGVLTRRGLAEAAATIGAFS